MASVIRYASHSAKNEYMMQSKYCKVSSEVKLQTYQEHLNNKLTDNRLAIYLDKKVDII